MKGLGPEHPGRTRGISAIAPWKTGRDWKLEDKRACKKAKKELYEQKMREKMKNEIIEELKQEFQLNGAPIPPSLLLTPPLILNSSCASSQVVTATDRATTSYPCDRIEVINPLIMHV